MPGWGTLIGAGIGLVGGMMGGAGAKKAQRKAEKANKQRYRAMLEMLRTQGQATKADIRAGAVEERGAAVQSAAGRGLYNSSVLDTLQSQANDREARALAQVDQSVTDRAVGVMNDRVDAYPDTGPAMNAMQVAGASLPGLIDGAIGVFGKKAPAAPTLGQAAGNAVGGVTTAAAKSTPYARLLDSMKVPAAPSLTTAKNGVMAAGAAARPVVQGVGNAIGRYMRPRPRAGMYSNLAASL
jgi:hypothetical protein